MTQLQTILYNLLDVTEGFAAIIAIIYYKQLKSSYWKWFVIYLIFIAIAEIFSIYFLDNLPKIRKYYFDFLVIPVEFLFFYWLYAKKSLQSNKLFWTSCTIYFLFYLLHFFHTDQVRMISSMSYTVGVFLLAIMVYLEFIKQIRSDEILHFKNNKMFYINIGVMLFYIGTLPFFAFDKYLFQNMFTVWNYYETFFLLSVNIMYILFAMSFIWGKSKQ
jgi:hypothetical protein